jgi:hypothetical protein
MKIDSLEHKDLLLQIIQGTPIQGDFIGVSEMVKRIGSLVEAIEKAEIEGKSHVET